MIRDRIPYEILVQGALRDVIRQVLADIAAHGLPGEHHFYITFHTHIAGVEMSPRLKERYPDHVTIVLQNQFWDLAVDDEKFSVTLSFSDVPERLVVPFLAIQAFYDPAASFEASFDVAPQLPVATPPVTIFAPKSEPEQSSDSSVATMRVGIRKSSQNVQETTQGTAPSQTGQATSKDSVAGNSVKGADIVSLDAFRKK